MLDASDLELRTAGLFDALAGLFCTLVGLAVGVGVPVWMVVHARHLRQRLVALEERAALTERQLAVMRATLDAVRVSAASAGDRGGAATGETTAPSIPAPAAAPPVEPSVAVSPAPPFPAPPASVTSPPVTSPPASPPPVPSPPVPAPSLALPPPPRVPPPPAFQLPGIETIAVWIAAALGGVVLVVAVLFGLQLAINAGYFGPAARFTSGVLLGLGCWAVGELLWAKRYRVPAAAFIGGGSAVFYGVVYAGHVRYGLIGQPIAMGAMVALTVVTMISAVRRDHLLLAILSLFGGFLTPILLSTGENKAVAFFAYLTLLDAGFVWAATRRRWSVVVGLAAAVTAVLHVSWGIRFRAPDQVGVALGAAAVLGLLFLLLPWRYRAGAARGPGVVDLAEAVAGVGGSVLLFLVGGAFVVPADPMNSDPRSGLPLTWSLGESAWLAAAYVLLVAIALGVTGARRAWPVLRVVTAVATLLLLFPFTVGWASAGEPRLLPVVATLALVPVVVLLTGLAGERAPRTGTGLGALFERPGEAESLIFLGVAGLLGALAMTVGAPPLATQLGLALALGLVGGGLGYGLGYRPALPMGTVAAGIVLLPGLTQRVADGEGGALFGAAAALYVLYAWPPLWRARNDDLSGAIAAVLAAVVGFPVFHRVWVGVLGDDAIGLLAVILGVHTLLGAIAIRRAGRVAAPGAFGSPFTLLIGVTLLFAAVAIPLQLREGWLTVGWALEVVALAWLWRRIPERGVLTFAVGLAAAVIVRLLFNPSAYTYGGGAGPILFNWTLYTWGLPAVCLLVAAGLLQPVRWLPRALRIASIALFFVLVNLEVAHAFARDEALSFTSENLAESMTRSISWGLFGLVLITVGVTRRSQFARLLGFGFTLLAAAKVLLLDVVNLSGIVRVGSFAGLAVVLLVAAIAFQRVVLRGKDE